MPDGTQLHPAVGASTPASLLEAGPAFARHDTFAPRHGWIKKGYDLAQRTPTLFSRPDASTELGVGKNMVRAIRYWCHAFGVLEPAKDEASNTIARATDLGTLLLDDQRGLDPYLEDPATLWWLHWRLVNRPDLATAWSYTFFEFARTEFTVRDLSLALQDYVGRTFPDARYADSSYEKDASCLVRMYGVQDDGGRPSEDTIQCPFAELELLSPGTEPGTWAFQLGPKPSLPSRLVAAACLEYAARSTGARTLALPRLLHEPGSPGMAFKLTQGALYGALEEVVAVTDGLALADAAGVIQLAFEADPRMLATRVWTGHYPRGRTAADLQEVA
jgi:hypothetical protein